MNLLNTLLIYLTMVFVSSVQMAPEPTLAPSTPSPSPTVSVVAVVTTVAASPTLTPTPVPTPNITPNAEYRTLQVGDTGDNVTLMQRRLAELGYYTGDIDGVYGNQTRRAVERFQYYNGLSVDGIAGKRTLTVLYESTEVVFSPVDVTPSPTPTPTPTPAPTDTPAPTFAPTPTPGASPTPTPTPSPEPSASPEAAASEEPTDLTQTVTGPALLEQTDFVLAGGTEPLTLQNEAALALPEPVTLHPLQNGETVLVPILEILRDAGSVILPGTDTVVWEVAFTLNEDLYQFSYQTDDAGNVTELTVLKNQEPQAVTDATGFMLDGVLYLPIQTTTENLGVTFALDEAAVRYTVTLTPAQGGQENGATS